MAAVIHVVDDDEAMRTALARLLRAEGYTVNTYASAGDFLLAPAPPDVAGCLLLDLHMPGPSGLDLQRALERYPVTLPVVFLTGRGDIESSVRAMKAGAVDFLTKPVQPAALLGAIEAALGRGRRERERRQDSQQVRACYATLTARERAVFAYVVLGRANKQIADALGITERTVKMHRAQVMTKMRCTSVAQLVQLAQPLHETGELKLPDPRPTPPPD